MTEAQNKSGERYCPICENWMDDEVCPTDQVPTIRREILEEQSNFIPEGTILGGRYEIKRLIGVGGMGAVYLGNQTNIHRRVAIKTLKKELMSNERLLKRFYREARAAAALDHPNIVKVYDFGLDSEQGCPYIAMEYLEGQSLDSLIENEGRLSEARACVIVGAVARALTDAHNKGVVHRDLKPDNVHVQSLSDGTEHIKVLDFGIAKIRRPDGTPTEKLTGTGMALGTPYYMSPEQAMGKAADFRSDLYGLGCILYQLLAGELPFDAEQPMAVLLKQLREPAPPLPDQLCDGAPPSESLRDLYASLMAKKPEDRPNSTLYVADRLTECVKRARGLTGGDSDFAFGQQTLGPSESKGNRSAGPGLETLVRSSMGEKETLAFGAVDEAGNSMDATPAVSASTDDIAALQPRRTPQIIMVIALLFGLGTGAWFMTQGSASNGSKTTSPRAPTKASVKDVSTQQTSTKVGTAKTVPKKVKIEITSVPSGADVFVGDDKLGKTPVRQSVLMDVLPMKIRVQKDGFEPKDRLLTKASPLMAVTLLARQKPTNVTRTKLKKPGAQAPKKTKRAAKKATSKTKSRRVKRSAKASSTKANPTRRKKVRRIKKTRVKSKAPKAKNTMEAW